MGASRVNLATAALAKPMTVDYTNTCADIERAVEVLSHVRSRLAETIRREPVVLKMVSSNQVFGLVTESDLDNAHQRVSLAKLQLAELEATVKAYRAHRRQQQTLKHLRLLGQHDNAISSKLYTIEKMLKKRDLLLKQKLHRN